MDYNNLIESYRGSQSPQTGQFNSYQIWIITTL